MVVGWVVGKECAWVERRDNTKAVGLDVLQVGGMVQYWAYG